MLFVVVTDLSAISGHLQLVVGDVTRDLATNYHELQNKMRLLMDIDNIPCFENSPTDIPKVITLWLGKYK